MRVALFRLSAVVLLVFDAVLPFSLLGVVAPWVLPGNSAAGFTAAIHRWHGAQFGDIWGLLTGGVLVALLFKPASKPGLVQFLIAIEVVDVLLAVLAPSRDNFQPVFFFGTLIFLVILVATYPDRQALLRLRSNGPTGQFAIALTAAVALPLIYDMYRNLSLHLAGVGGEDLHWGHWTNAIAADLHLVLAGILVSLRVAGWRVLSLLTGVALIALGASGVATPDQAGTWGAVGGGAAVLAGLGYMALAVGDRYLRPRQVAATVV